MHEVETDTALEMTEEMPMISSGLSTMSHVLTMNPPIPTVAPPLKCTNVILISELAVRPANQAKLSSSDPAHLMPLQ